MKETLKDGSVVEKCYNGYRLLQCPDVEHYKMPDEVVEVSPTAFENAKKLQSIDFNNVERLEAQRDYIYDEVPYFEGTGWAGYEKEVVGKVYHSIFENCPFVSQIEMPHVKSIHEFALSGLKQLHSIILPECMTLCSNFAFYGSAVESIKAKGKFFNTLLYYNHDIIYANSEGQNVQINPDDLSNSLFSLRHLFLYDKDTSDVMRAMYTVSKLPNIADITVSTSFIASLLREIYSEKPFAENISDAGVTGDSINRIKITCLYPRKYCGMGKGNGFYAEIKLTDKDYIILKNMIKNHPEIRKDVCILQEYKTDLYNTIWNTIIKSKNGDQPIERMELTSI